MLGVCKLKYQVSSCILKIPNKRPIMNPVAPRSKVLLFYSLMKLVVKLLFPLPELTFQEPTVRLDRRRPSSINPARAPTERRVDTPQSQSLPQGRHSAVSARSTCNSSANPTHLPNLEPGTSEGIQRSSLENPGEVARKRQRQTTDEPLAREQKRPKLSTEYKERNETSKAYSVIRPVRSEPNKPTIQTQRQPPVRIIARPAIEYNLVLQRNSRSILVRPQSIAAIYLTAERRLATEP